MKTNPWLEKLIVTAAKVVRHPYSRKQKYLAIRSIPVKMLTLAYLFKNPHSLFRRSLFMIRVRIEHRRKTYHHPQSSTCEKIHSCTDGYEFCSQDFQLVGQL